MIVPLDIQAQKNGLETFRINGILTPQTSPYGLMQDVEMTD